jgi:NTE family protein
MTFIDRARAFIGLADTVPKWPPDRLSLALQGGGSFGAFTWGVLDRLLEEPGVSFDAISGASAGAVNAVLMAAGLVDGGPDEARARLAQFWRRMSRAAALIPKPTESPFGPGFDLVIRSLSPYQFNPFNLNPMREALVASVDFERLKRRSPIKLLLAATRVSDGRLRILTNADLTVEAVLASACLPLLHHTIEIDGEAYWDGGYAANPPLIPLIRASECDHALIVQVTPIKSDRLPKTSRDISRRIEQIQFNATLNSELETLKSGKMIGATEKLRRLRIGRISVDEEIEGLADESAGNLDWDFLERLHASGRVAADLWLKQDMPQSPSARRPDKAAS